MQHIEIDEFFGSASGYVVESSAEQVGNYLAQHLEDHQRVVEWLNGHCRQVAFLKNLNVNEGERGIGHGNELLEQFVAEAEDFGADAILLIADSGEKQADGFELVGWYEGFDFVSVRETTGGPLMIYPHYVAEKMQENLK